MKIDKVKEDIKNTIKVYLLKDDFGQYSIPSNKQRPIFLLGAPGIGKTAIVEQVASELKLGFISYSITHHTRQSAIGLPFITERSYEGKTISITEYTLSEIIASVYDAIEQQNIKEGILFIDEINCVSETLAPSMLDLLQNKKFGPHKIPKGWILVTAGNPIIYNSSAREFDTVTMDRIKKIEVNTEFEVWKKYALVTLIHNSIIYYLQMKPQNILVIEKTVDGDSFVTPRGWEDLSVIIEKYENRNINIDFDIIYQYVQHNDIAHDFYNFYILFQKYKQNYIIEDLFNGKQDLWKKKLENSKFDEKIAVIQLLTDYVNLKVYNIELNYKKTELFDSFFRSINVIEANDLVAKIDTFININKNILKNNVLETFDKHNRNWLVVELLNIKHKINNSDFGIKNIEDLIRVRKEVSIKDSNEIIFEITKILEFIDNYFGKSQELVLLLMNLISSQYFVKFISKNECPLFFELNELMLIGDQNRELMNEIKSYKELN